MVFVDAAHFLRVNADEATIFNQLQPSIFLEKLSQCLSDESTALYDLNDISLFFEHLPSQLEAAFEALFSTKYFRAAAVRQRRLKKIFEVSNLVW